MQGEQANKRHSSQQGIGIEQVPETANIVHVRVDGYTFHDIGDRYTPQEARLYMPLFQTSV
ncbi:hypothetical protein KSC_014440 [Ktedonobacter sp. SOSP1-52]|nr:hypothetical protein KSC_014440 [Ktedonobacter sp. SOSP1-52]